MVTHFCQDIHKVSMLQQNQREIFWQQLNKQRNEGQMCDVTFKCHGGEVAAHKCVLACLSEYFKVLLTSPISTASTTNNVVLEDFSVDVVTLLLDVIYGEADIPAVHVVELLKLADFVQMQWLVDVLVEKIRKFISEGNVFHWYAAAKRFGFSKLMFLCECFARENIEKLHPKNVEECFGSNYLNDIYLWDTALNREIVLLPARNGQDILLDPMMKSATILNGDISLGSETRHELPQVWKDKGDLKTAFVHQNIVYIVTEKKKQGWASSVYSIWKFQHVDKTLALTAELREDGLKCLLSDEDATKIERGLDIGQLFYDGQGNLYVSCTIRKLDEGTSEQCIFKFHIESHSFFVGYVIGDQLLHKLAYLDKDGTCLVTPDFIFVLHQNSFEVAGFPAEALFKIELNNYIVNTVLDNEELQSVQTDDLDWDSWFDFCYSANKNGTFYSLVDNMEHDTYYNLILRLGRLKMFLIKKSVYSLEGCV